MFSWKFLISLCLLLMVNGLTAELENFDGEQVELELSLSQQYHRDPYHIFNYKNHSCKRPCEKDGPSKVCHYYFLLEHFTTMSAACYGCPGNATECFLPQCVPADGVPRGILTVNRMVPGPIIDVCEGDTVEILVDNRMELGEGTSIHWHGLRQKGSQHMDGTSLVTQCPLHTWAKMKYRYETKDPGTHFWHAHSTIQRSEGLSGGLVIRRPHALDPQGHLYDHDLTDHYIILSDWTHKTAGSAYAQDFHDGQRTEVKSILVNGLGSAEEGSEMPHPVFHVQAGQRYRFRVAFNGIFNCPIYIKVDNHTLLMIASDGQNVEPLEVDAFMIFSGERYDFVLEAKEGVMDNFWMRFKGHGRCTGSSIFQTAILRYEGAEDEKPEGIATYSNTDENTGERMLNGRSGNSTENTFQVVDLRALERDNQDQNILTEKPDKQFYISLGASEVLDERFLPPPNPYSRVTTMKPPPVRPFNHQLNYISSRLPPSPPLSQYYDIPQDLLCNNDTMTEDCTKVQCICVHMLNFDLGDLVEIVLVSFSKTLIHPMHMHGHSYRVVSQYSVGRDITVKEVKAMDKRGEIPRVTSRAPFKDTIGAHDQSVTILRFRADNPGFWFFHCHIEFHAELGMSLILQAGKPEEMPKPPKGFPRCGSFRLEDDDSIASSKDGNEPKKTQNLSAEGGDEADASSTIGLVIGSVLALIVLGLAVVYIVLRKPRRRNGLFEHVRTMDNKTYGLLKV